MTVPSSGTNGNPITFGAFGTGTNPLIDGSFQINNWHETVTGNHIWATPISDPTGVVIVNGTPGTETASSTSGLVFSDDFESGNLSKWAVSSGGLISTNQAESGTRSMQSTAWSMNPYSGRNDSTVYIHFWVYIPAYPADYSSFVAVTSANTKDVTVSIGPSSDHKFYIVNGGGTTVAGPSYNLNTWYEIEFRATIGTGSNAVGQLRINGTSVATSSNGTGTGGYTTIYFVPESDVYYDDFIVRTDTWPRDATPVYTNVNSTGKWAYDGTYNQELYVYALTTPTVLVASSWQGIIANNKSYITLNGLAVKYWKDNGVRLIGGTNHVVSNMDIEQNGSTGLLIVDQAGAANDIVQNNIVDGNKEGGLFIGGNGNQNVIVSGNKLTNNINRTSDQGDQLRIISINSGLQVYNNFILRPTPFTPPPTGNDEGIDCANTCNNADIHNNVVIGSYIDVKNGTTGAKIYNNTVYVPSTAAANTSAFYATGDSTGTILRNNIFVDLVPSSRAIYLDPGAELNTTSNYNLIYDHSGSVANINNAVYNTLANLQAAGFDVNSVSSDPLFINTSGLFNTASDFSLLSTSPAIDSGISLGDTYKLGLNPNSVWPSSVNTLDQTLNGLGWDIGAYIYTESTLPTVSLTAPSNSSTVSSSLTLSATASDNSAVAGVQFKLDTNTNIGAEDTTSTYGVTWDSTAALDGTHTLIAVARDTYGNYATSTAVTVTVHNAVAVTSNGGGNGAPVGLIGQHTQNISNLLTPTTPASTSTSLTSLQDQIISLTLELNSLLAQAHTTTATSYTPYNFTRNLSLHATGADVKQLQQFLNVNGFIISTTGAGSLGNETTLFGLLTYKALTKFQKSVGLPATGFFGPMTRAVVGK